MGRLSNKAKIFHVLAIGLVLALAAFIRYWAAPLSTGPDVAQFWAFAREFQLHGLDFYRYADASAETLPFQWWGFVYPPVWLLVLKGALLAAPSSSATSFMVDAGWRLAMKTPIILADLAIGVILYQAVSGSRLRRLVFACLWLLHPTSWYESAVFGQFDAIAAAFLLASLLMLERGRDKLAFLFAGLAVMTKQHTLLPLAMMWAISARRLGKRWLVHNSLIFLGVVVAMSIPFLLTGNLPSYARAVILPMQGVDYQEPLEFTFSGSGALVTYLHHVFGWENVGLLHLNSPVLVIALLAAIVLVYRRSVTLAQGALIGLLLFIAIFYRINYQYLVVYIPIALLAASRAHYRDEKIVTLALAMLPAAWLWLFNVSAWFVYMEPYNSWVRPLLAHIGPVQVMGVPACALYFKTTSFDLLLPRLLAGLTITRQDLAQLTNGAFCLDCKVCTFPQKCPFGK